MNDKLDAGDFVHCSGMREEIRIVIYPSAIGFGFAKYEIGVLALGESRKEYFNNVIRGSGYEKITPTNELIEDAKESLRCSLLAKRKAYLRYVDNLTYIEIMEKLNGYDSRIS